LCTAIIRKRHCCNRFKMSSVLWGDTEDCILELLETVTDEELAEEIENLHNDPNATETITRVNCWSRFCRSYWNCNYCSNCIVSKN